VTEPLNVFDYEALAAERLEAGALGYFGGGAGDEHTLRWNVEAFTRWQLRPRLLVDGRSIADSADRLEGTFPRFSLTRHPRTGIGFSRDSTKLYFVTVDGRSESSSGMSLTEFATLMQTLGIAQGLNLDGGGSTTLVIRGHVVNHPSDSTGERAVGDALLLLKR